MKSKLTISESIENFNEKLLDLILIVQVKIFIFMDEIIYKVNKKLMANKSRPGREKKKPKKKK